MILSRHDSVASSCLRFFRSNPPAGLVSRASLSVPSVFLLFNSFGCGSIARQRSLNAEPAHAKVAAMADTDNAAYLLRENTGTTGIEQTARTVAERLAHFAIPHLIVG